MRTLSRMLAVVGLSAGLAVPMLSPASADPKGDTFSLTCGSTAYQIVVKGNGTWSPAHDLGSTRVFIPHAFQGFHGEVYDTDGNLVGTFDDPGVQTQGSGKQKNDLSCTFSFVEVSDGTDPDFPVGFTFVGSGGVTGQLSGRR